MKDKGLDMAGQFETLLKVLDSGWITDWSCAVDGGANVGEWAAEMASRFDIVHAFEPAPDTFERLRQNMAPFDNVVIHQNALLDRAGAVEVDAPEKRKKRHRSRYVRRVESGEILAVTVDWLQLPSCGLLKLDLEGAEYDAIIGAAETIKRCRPVIIAEVDGRGASNGFKHTNDDVRGLLRQLCYVETMERRPDSVFVPAERL